MTLTYAEARAFVFDAERGFADVAGDPGGKTSDGVASHANPAAWADGVVTEEEREHAYRSRWDAIQGDELAALVPRSALVLFDWYFHSGGLAVRALQRIVYPQAEHTARTVDGSLGPGTLARLGSWLSRPGAGSRADVDRDLCRRLLVARAEQLEGWIEAAPAERAKFLGGFVKRLVLLALRG
jgi:lysozyme family protein